MEIHEPSTYERITTWIRKSVTLKLVIITILMLLLLIPTSMVDSIIYERQSLRGQALTEVSSIWAKEQTISGPVLTIPIAYQQTTDQGETNTYTKKWNILPEQLEIVGDLSPKELKRGIYKVIVYNSKMKMKGSFKLPKPPESDQLIEIQYDKAYLTLGVSDLRGIEEEIRIKLGKEYLNVIPGTKHAPMINSGITSNVRSLNDSVKDLPFDIALALQGSRNMTFVPVGNTTEVKITSNWPSPSFVGNFLPDDRNVSETGFDAYWKVLQLNRNLPQSWMGSLDQSTFNSANFGLNLIPVVDDYQKATRSSKYAVMTIALTFLIFFLVEVMNGRKIHPFQYTLVGLSLCMFYVLLISISEHSNFDFAYLVSAAAIISMIALYSIKVFHSVKLSILLAASLVGTYGFLYTTLQMSEYALLMGSIGLTLILAATMYFTRNINWYNLSKAEA